jgi:nucleoside-diphosphate-sugar epimerase
MIPEYFAERRDWDKKNRLLASIEKARKMLGYNPNMDFKEGSNRLRMVCRELWRT